MKIVTCVLLLAAAGAPAQEAPTTDRTSAFLERVGAALRTARTPAAVRSFSARVLVTVDSKRGNADARATIDFLAPRYLKTAVREGGREIVRGKGDGLPWMQQDGRAYVLEGKDYARDRRAVYRDLAIASAMTHYLYPDRQLGSLTELVGPAEETIRYTRGHDVAALRVAGIARNGRDYPLALTPEHAGPIRVTVWFRKQDLFPLVIRLVPLRNLATRKQSAPVEELRFLDHRRYDDLVLPARVVFRGQGAGGRLVLMQKVRLLAFRANPAGLVPAAFALPPR